jgi:hypothetical protein
MSTAVGVQMESNSPIPKLRFEFRFARVEGAIAEFRFVAVGVTVVVEFTPKAERRVPSAQPLRAPEPATDWATVIGTGLLIAGAVTSSARSSKISSPPAPVLPMIRHRLPLRPRAWDAAFS